MPDQHPLPQTPATPASPALLRRIGLTDNRMGQSEFRALVRMSRNTFFALLKDPEFRKSVDARKERSSGYWSVDRGLGAKYFARKAANEQQPHEAAAEKRVAEQYA